MGIWTDIYKSIRGRTPYNGTGGAGGTQGSYSYLFSGGNYDYQKVIRLGLWKNAVFASGVDWLARNWNVPNFHVVEVDDEGIEKPVPRHPALRLFRRPHKHLGRCAFSASVTRDLLSHKGCWIEKVMPRSGAPVELKIWAADKVAPIFPPDGSEYLTHWEYTVNGTPIKVPASRVIYLRRYVDTENDRLGWTPSFSHVRPIAALNEADTYMAALLRNFCVPGLVATPKGDFTISREDAEAIKTSLMDDTGGENRGVPKVLTGSYDIHKVSYSPEEAGLTEIPKRLTALVLSSMGLNMDVLGLNVDGSGSYGSYSEAIRAAYVHGLMPLQALFADEMTHQLLPHYEELEDVLDGRIKFAWDYSPVEELDDREQVAANRAIRLFAGGVLNLNESRDIVGYGPADTPDAELLGMARDKARMEAGLDAPSSKVAEGDKVPPDGAERSKLEGERNSDALSPSRSGVNKGLADALFTGVFGMERVPHEETV